MNTNYLFLIPVLLIVFLAVKISRRIIMEKGIRGDLSKRVKENIHISSLDEAGEFEGYLTYLNSSGRREELSLVTFLLFDFYRKNHAGDMKLVARARELGEVIRKCYRDARLYSDALFELGNLYFFVISDLDKASEIYSYLMDERPDSRWFSIARDRVNIISENHSNRTALNLYIAAERFIEEGKFREALEYLHLTIENDSNSLLTPSALLIIGDGYYSKFSDYKSAMRYYRRAADDYSSTSAGRQSLFKYGEILMETERWEDAIAVYREFISKYPDSPLRDDAHYYIGEAYQNMGRLREAKNAFSLILGDFPESKWTEVIYKRVQELNSGIADE